jgi:hypothetical protein
VVIAPVPVAWLNQVEKSCAISDRGDERASGSADGGVCAWTDPATSGMKNTDKVAAFSTATCTIFPCSAPNDLRYELNWNWGDV